ncbi:MAG: bifunctional heptose 7-phosphate kinase/heptose 1-phosphate adenyltransferase [Candidatus Aminicenantia bacterium]
MVDKEKLLKVIKGFKGKRIVVFGDLILDEYVYGKTSRVSREAPVLIIKYESNEFNLGGGANSIKNIHSLNGIPVPVGIVGADEEGKKLLKILEELGITTEFIIKNKYYKTPLKTRILAGGEHTRRQQVLRVDREEKISFDNNLREALFKNLIVALSNADALLISDYDNGTVDIFIFEKIVKEIKDRIPIALDSRHRLLKFKGVTIATPNEQEVEEALHFSISDSEEELFKAGKRIIEELNSPALLITRGYKGMCLFEKEKEPVSIPIFGSDEIVDVTGAGDTVISTVTLAISSGANFLESAFLSNLAGGNVVMKEGAATLSPVELEEAVISALR